MADTARLDELRRRVQADPASVAFAALAEEYRKAGRLEDAVTTALQLAPQDRALREAVATLESASVVMILDADHPWPGLSTDPPVAVTNAPADRTASTRQRQIAAFEGWLAAIVDARTAPEAVAR